MTEDRKYSSLALETVVASGLDEDSLSLTAEDASSYLETGPYIIAVGIDTSHFELMEVVSRLGNTFTISADGRGIDSTLQQQHDPGEKIWHVPIADDFREMRAHMVDDDRDDHPQYMMADGTRHDLTARHPIGDVVPLGDDGDIQPIGGAASAGDPTTGTAATDHIHPFDADSITETELANNSVSSSQLQNDSVIAGKIADGAIDDDALFAATVIPKSALLTEVMNLFAPIGGMIPYGGDGTVLPATWLPCDGAAVLRADYVDLFAIIGTTYGIGDGSSSFNLPDFRGRSPLGSGNGSGLTARTRGQSAGEESHTLLTAELPAHTHNILTKVGSGAGSSSRIAHDNGTGTNDTTATASEGSGTAHNNMSPYLVTNFIIRVL